MEGNTRKIIVTPSCPDCKQYAKVIRDLNDQLAASEEQHRLLTARLDAVQKLLKARDARARPHDGSTTVTSISSEIKAWFKRRLGITLPHFDPEPKEEKLDDEIENLINKSK